MPVIAREIRLGLDEDEKELLPRAAKKLNIPKNLILRCKIVRQSVDARNKNDIHFKYSVALFLSDEKTELEFVKRYSLEYEAPDKNEEIFQGTAPLFRRPVVAGMGPAGLFAAYFLSLYGYKPLVIERGREMAKREQDVSRLCGSGVLNTESNVCFGEGGAGAFSDGKLTTRIKDKRVHEVLKVLVTAGAPDNILYSAKPHMGTENIRKAVTAIRKMIIKNGGEVQFETRLSRIGIQEGKLCHAVLAGQSGEIKIDSDILVLATGHSARDTYAMLQQNSIMMQKKPFAIGLRIEHPRELIDRSQYGAFSNHPRLGAAEYRLTTRNGNRGVYTFCMCPGGEVINSSTEAEHIAVNGMSYYKRDLQNSNSALVVTVGTDDLPGDALAGVEFQRQWEHACYSLTGGAGVPAQRVQDFMAASKTLGFHGVYPSIKPYAVPADLHQALPRFVSLGIEKGIADFGRQLKGFDMPDAVLTGVETRTSAPVSIPRDENLECVGNNGIYPAGEGGGHAGGIVSAAVDGMKVAEAIIRKYKPCY